MSTANLDITGTLIYLNTVDSFTLTEPEQLQIVVIAFHHFAHNNDVLTRHPENQLRRDTVIAVFKPLECEMLLVIGRFAPFLILVGGSLRAVL